MSVERLQSFIGHLRSNRLMEQADVIRVVRHMQQLDRRIGQLALLRGFMTPEQVSKVMLSQTQINKRFVEMAEELGYLTHDRGQEILRLQRDDLFAFAQSAVALGVKSLPDMVGLIRQYLTQHPAVTAEKDDKAVSGKLGANIRATLQKIKGIAPLPGVVTKVVQMLDDPKTSMETVGKVLMADPGLVTTLLRIVNSAFYGLRSQAKTITQGLVVLGTRKVKELVLVAGVMQKFRDVPKDAAEKFWDHGILTAQWTKEVGTHLKMPDVDLLFINGFIHNIGDLIILQHFPGEMAEIERAVELGADRMAAERQALGGTHPDISAFLFEIWQFPPAMIQGAMLHHHPLPQILQMSSLKREALLVHMAASITSLDHEMDPFELLTQTSAVAANYQGPLKLGDLVIEDIAVSVRDKAADLKNMFAF